MHTSSKTDIKTEAQIALELELIRARKLTGNEMMSWKIKALPFPMLAVDITMGVAMLVPFGLFFYGYLVDDPAHEGIGLFVMCFWLFLWKMVVRQKNLYHYRITDQAGEVTYWMDFPEGVITFLKWLSGIFFVIVLCMAAVEPSFIWMLVGPAGMAIGGAKFLLGWENRKTNEVSSPWNEYNFVTVDRKRKMVIAHRSNLTVGFEVHLPNDLFDKYLDTLKQVLPSSAVFTETPWKW